MLFSTAMVQEISAHIKRLTRRTRNLEGINKAPNDYHAHINYMESDNINASFINIKDNTLQNIKCPYGNPGDSLYVKETYQDLSYIGEDYGIVYKASENGKDWAENDESWTWKPSIFMPKKFARIFLKIQTVSICRLHNITREEAIMEGVEQIETDAMPVYRDYLDKNNFHHDPINSFRSLWISINGEASWKLNPWVWEIKFQMIETEDAATKARKEVSHES